MLLFKAKRCLVLVLQWLFAIVAFSTCIGFSTTFDYSVTCANGDWDTRISHPIKYPFDLDKRTSSVTCSKDNNRYFSMSVYIPGDYQFGAEFFFIFGVVSFLVTSFALIMLIVHDAHHAHRSFDHLFLFSIIALFLVYLSYFSILPSHFSVLFLHQIL